jgi:Uma2 family endonuclease
MTERYDRPTDGTEKSDAGEVDVTAMLDSTTQARPRLLDLEAELPEAYKKAEIVGGALIMSPLRAIHGETLFRLQMQLADQLPGEFWFVYDVLTPFPLENHEFCPDVAVIPKKEADRNISVCDPSLIQFVFEIISESTASIDYKTKVGAYARAGIPEYVIFDPYTRRATRYARPRAGKYQIREVVTYGEAVRIEEPFSCVIETSVLPVNPKD